MVARIIKSLVFGSSKNAKGYIHREHRSKKGRSKPKHQENNIRLYKKKLAELKEEDYEM
jgi:hypothetical protein